MLCGFTRLRQNRDTDVPPPVTQTPLCSPHFCAAFSSSSPPPSVRFSCRWDDASWTLCATPHKGLASHLFPFESPPWCHFLQLGAPSVLTFSLCPDLPSEPNHTGVPRLRALLISLAPISRPPADGGLLSSSLSSSDGLQKATSSSGSRGQGRVCPACCSPARFIFTTSF